MSQRLWFKIGDAAKFAGVSPRDVRYWENVIPELRPRRSKGNLRYYYKDDLPKLCAIKAWIEQGFTVADCREILLNGCITRDLGLDTENSGTPETKGGAEHPATKLDTGYQPVAPNTEETGSKIAPVQDKECNDAPCLDRGCAESPLPDRDAQLPWPDEEGVEFPWSAPGSDIGNAVSDDLAGDIGKPTTKDFLNFPGASLQLLKAIDLLKKLLARLQKPVS